ncbi:MAG: histidine kinase dimerization/phosphoacceptor domain -containing protein [Pseudomonadota bacterium]
MVPEQTGIATALAGIRAVGPQIALFLTVALLPIGLIAIYQTRSATQLANEQLDATYVALTSEAALPQRELIQRAFGATDALLEMLKTANWNVQTCTQQLVGFQSRHPEYTSAAYITVNGFVPCSSTGRLQDISKTAIWQALSEEQRPQVVFQGASDISTNATLVVASPVFSDDGMWQGYAVVSIPSSELNAPVDPDMTIKPIDVIVFSQNGDILSDASTSGKLEAHLPKTGGLTSLIAHEKQAVMKTAANNSHYRYVVSPILRDNIYALAIWPAERGTISFIPSAIFPVLMWLASLVVAYFALHRLVLRHLRHLNAEMRYFGRQRRLISVDLPNSAPFEFQQLHDQFLEMARAVLRDEKQLERSVAQKSVLLKEVHHRVKNNLQLISSIMNMQIREAEGPETKRILTRLQDRIIGLALIHRNLHEIEEQGKINAGRMLEDLLANTVASAARKATLDLTSSFDEVVLYPDQTVPLSLLFSELVANALKHAGAAEGEQATLNIEFRVTDEGDAVLLVENTVSDATGDLPESTGLGRRLIGAFATQLGGEVETRDDPGFHAVSVRFEPQDFQPEHRDF